MLNHPVTFTPEEDAPHRVSATWGHGTLLKGWQGEPSGLASGLPHSLAAARRKGEVQAQHGEDRVPAPSGIYNRVRKHSAIPALQVWEW